MIICSTLFFSTRTKFFWVKLNIEDNFLTLSDFVTLPVDGLLPVAVGAFFVKVQAGGARVFVRNTVGAVVELVTRLKRQKSLVVCCWLM